MSTTEELLSLLEKQFVGWNRDGDRGLRHYLNLAQRMLCNVPADQLMIFDETTGKLPVINTTSTDYAYNLASTVNFVDSVLVESDTNATLIDNLWRQDYGRTSRSHRREAEEVNISGVKYIKVPFVRSYPATENNAAKVVFTENPGTTTNTYRYRGYKLPSDIVSDTIALTIHPPWDMLLLLPATAKLIEGVQHGNYVDAVVAVQEKFVPEMHKAFNVGAFGIYHEAEDHGF